MLYQFPPPDWFEPETTSNLLGQILLWCIAVGLPGSIAALWYWQPRTKLVWIAAIFLWICALALNIVMFVAPVPLTRVFRYTQPYLGIVAGLALLLLPLPAIAAGLNELPRTNTNPNGFREPRTWGCAKATLVAGYVALILLFPHRSPHAEAELRSMCKNNLKEIGLAMHNYHDAFAKFPDARTSSADSPSVSWRVSILPYFEHEKPNVEYDPTSEWSSDKNTPVAKSDVRLFVCRSVPLADQKDAAGRYYSAYATLIGPGTVFDGGQGKTIREITDGTSNTAFVVEACGQQVVWTEPRDIEVLKDNLGINLPGAKLGQSTAAWSSYHQGGAYTLLGDGAVRFLSKNTDPSVLKAISTASGGETMGDY